MRRFIIYISLLATSAQLTLAQTPPADTLEALQSEQATLRHRQDSLQSALNNSRASIGSVQATMRDSLSRVIVTLEGELFDVRAKLNRVGSDLASFEGITTQESQSGSTTSQSSGSKIYQHPTLAADLSKKDIEILSSMAKVERDAIVAIQVTEELYSELEKLKAEYDSVMTQDELDAIILKADTIKSHIEDLDRTSGKLWNDSYNHSLGIYLVMLDRTANVDRTKLESIERESRNMRREETFLQDGSIAPHLATFALQRSMLLSYQDAIATANKLTGNYSILSGEELEAKKREFKDIDFLPRVLYIYSDIEKVDSYPADYPNGIPEVILPERGLYYSVQIALLSSKVTSNSMFRGAWPLQVQTTPSKKYRYIIGGFRTYAAAAEGVKTLSKMGFKAPRVVGFIDGEYADNKECQAYEKSQAIGGGYKVTLKTTSSSSAEALRSTMEMHASGKSATRVLSGEDMVLTVTQFESKEEAEVFAQILREKTGEDRIIVEQIKL